MGRFWSTRRSASRQGADTQLVTGLYGFGGATAGICFAAWTGSQALSTTLVTVSFYGPNSETVLKQAVAGVLVTALAAQTATNGLDNANWKVVVSAPGFRDVVARWNAGT